MDPTCRRITAYGSVWWNTKSIIDRLICEQYLQYSQQKLSKNNTNFGRAVERERSELRNASPKERKSQVWKQKLSKKWSQGILGGSRERILPTCGPSLITPKGQRRDPDASDDKKHKQKISEMLGKKEYLELLSWAITTDNRERFIIGRQC